MRVLYFAWLRERIGAAQEELETSAATLADLVTELRGRSDGHALAFADLKGLRAAIDQELVSFDAALGDAREVAFFPPMTGG
ncbi:molybdopterin converting factor subunit 1 [Gemmobacter serpentinus]|uniref:molybdopterin converting factor subunit 1 n=1 Tax=Gemmobacter serpentinus TaxID=2652247 RepID=UPI00124F5612|nr:molybdopterin converting factor subunit 1 [Gemmobacter serpentinus]